MSAEVDWSKLEKFSGARKYFNISILWIFYYRHVIRLLYYTRVHPHFVLFLSVLCGAISVYLLWFDKLIAAAILLHFKDIFDASDGKGYVGSAYGEANLYGRWLNYAARGHGGNKLLKERDPRNFRFSILQRVSPDMSAGDLIRLESSWKERLHTRQPFGLNDN